VKATDQLVNLLSLKVERDREMVVGDQTLIHPIEKPVCAMGENSISKCDGAYWYVLYCHHADKADGNDETP